MAHVLKKSEAKIVIIGGGTGVFTVLSGLKNYFYNLTAIVTMADDGGSAGILREDFGILPPGDVRRALVALAKTDNKALSRLFNYRFHEGAGLSGHNFGNLMLTALTRITGSFEKAISEASRILASQGEVIPVTRQMARLYAKLENGQVIKGETNIDIPSHDGNIKIKQVWLKPAAKLNPRARKAILEADAVILGPGDLYTSIIPNILVRGMGQILKKTEGKIIYFVNTMTKHGETNGFQASDFLRTMEKYLGKDVIDYVVVNGKKPNTKRLKSYTAENSSLVKYDKKNFRENLKIFVADVIRSRGFMRHDPGKTARLIKKLIRQLA
ncbi:MAG: YvcK family protein [Patescibacteria group bacterium]|nr:YvcK family protein [Patescibacteria group bacterium]